jgi:hypothetical protein
MWVWCVIILLILLMLWQSGRSDSDTTDIGKELYTQTTGHVLDSTAVHAISRAKRKHKKHKHGYKKSEAGDVASNTFMLGSLLNFNVEPNMPEPKRKKIKRKAAKQFNETIATIVQHPNEVVQNTPQPVNFMVDRIEDFYNDYLIQTLRTAELTPELVVPNFPAVRQAVRNANRNNSERVAALSAHMPKKQDMQQVYYTNEIPSDPQNVHDTNVNTDIHRKFKKLVENNAYEVDHNPYAGMPIREVYNSIKNSVKSHKFGNALKRQDAEAVLNTMHSPEKVGALGVSQMELLTEIWKRVHSPDNAERKDSLVGAFMDALADGRENGYTVCTIGKCNRLMGSLTLLDTDAVIATPVKTKEILRSEIFTKAHNIINDTLQKYPEPVVAAYQNPTKFDEAPEDVKIQVNDLEHTLKQNIATDIQNNYAKEVDATTLDILIEDAKAGV